MDLIVNPLRAKRCGAASAVPAAFAPETPASRAAAELAAVPAAARAAAHAPSAAYAAWHSYCAATGRPPPPPSVVLYAPFERLPPGRLARWFAGALSAAPQTLTVHILAPPCAVNEETEEGRGDGEENDDALEPALERIWARAPPGDTTLPRAVQLDIATLPFADDSCALDFFDFAATTTLARRLNVTLLCAEAVTYCAKRAVRAALGLRGSDADCALLVSPGGVPLDARHCARRATFPAELCWVRRTPVERGGDVAGGAALDAVADSEGIDSGSTDVVGVEGASALAPLPWQAKGEGGKVGELAYRAAVHAVVSGRVPLTVARAVELGALQVFIERVTHLSSDTERRVRARAQWERAAHGSSEEHARASEDGEDAPPEHFSKTFALLDAIADRLDAEAAAAEEEDPSGAERTAWARVAALEPLDFGGLGLVHRARAVASVAHPLALSRAALRAYVPCFVSALLPRERARPWLALQRELEARVACLAHDALIGARAAPRFNRRGVRIIGCADVEDDRVRALVAQHTNLSGLLYHVCRKAQRRYVAASRRAAVAGFSGAVAALGSTQRAHVVGARCAGAEAKDAPCLLRISTAGVAVSLHGRLYRSSRRSPALRSAAAPPVTPVTPVDGGAAAAAVRFVDLGPTQEQLTAAREVFLFADIARWRLNDERGTLQIDLDPVLPVSLVAPGNAVTLTPTSEGGVAQLGQPGNGRTVTLLLDDAVATERLLRDCARRTVDARVLGGRTSLWRLETMH